MSRARHLLSIADLDDAELGRLVDDASAVARGAWDDRKPLAGKCIGVYFRRTSTRTRTSFTVGAHRLGGSVIAYGPNDLQLATGESMADTGRVLANYLDALVVRTNDGIQEMRDLAAQPTMAVVNAMSEDEHPTQAIADLSAMREALGRLEGLHVLYLGEGNNTTAALALALAKTPRMRLTIVTPEGAGLPAQPLERARRLAAANGSVVEQHHRMDRLPEGVDVVYTTRWTTMGVPKADPNWLEHYRPYAVTETVMERVAKADTVFMHDLPAMRGQEVTDAVLDGPRSIAFRQAYHKLTAAMAVLAWSTGCGA